MIMLSLNQINQKQTEYITHISNRFCLLNAKIVSKKILINIQHEKYMHVLLNSELVISDKFHSTATHSMFKKQLSLIIINEAHLMSQ